MLKYLIKLPTNKEKPKCSGESSSKGKQLFEGDKPEDKENVENESLAQKMSKSPLKSTAMKESGSPTKNIITNVGTSFTNSSDSSSSSSLNISSLNSSSNESSQTNSKKRKRESDEVLEESESKVLLLKSPSTTVLKKSIKSTNTSLNDSTTSYSCDYCEKEYAVKQSLFRHIKTHHTDLDVSLTNNGANQSISDQEEREREESDYEESEDEEVYEVEVIRDYSYCKETEQGLYFVKWLNWPEDQNTWEPLANLNCREKLIQFYNERFEARKVAKGTEKRKLSLPPDPRESRDLRDLFLTKYWNKPSQEQLEELLKVKRNGKSTKLMPENLLSKEMESLAVANKDKEKRIQQVVAQLNIRELDKVRRNQLTELKNWEVLINEVEKDAYVSVLNDVDLEGPPTSMQYINAYKATEGIEIPDDPILGCECKECKIGSTCCCPGQAGYDFPYLANGKLRLNVGFPIYECNRRCLCPPTCRNRVVQKGRTIKMAIFRTSNGCGWGVKSLERIKEGTFVVSYFGEVITSEEAERRGKDYDAAGRTYLFDLDFNLGDENPYTVDAAHYGNLSHFINHSCDPNLSIFNVYINCLDPNLPQLCLFARRDIEKGEELTFDYCQSTQSLDTDSQDTSPIKSPQSRKFTGGSPNKAIGSPPSAKKVQENAKSFKSECRCGSKNCRKVLF